MLRRNYSLILMAWWLFIGVCLVLPVLPERYQQHLRPLGGAVEGGGLLAFVFAAYNLARWWSLQTLYRNRSAAARVNPLARHPSADEPTPADGYERNPDFDFVKPPSETPERP